MSALGPEARSLLDLGRRVTVPTAEEADRLWSRVREAVAPPAAPPGGAGATFGATIFAAAAITAAVVAVALLVTRAPPREPPVAAPSLVAVASATPAPASPREPPAPSAEGPVQPIAPPTVAAPTARVKPAPRATALAPADDRGDVALVRSAYEELRAGDAARSLALLDEHARRFPASGLAEERAATRVLALCALGRKGDARAALDRYRRAYPAGMQVQRVPKACLDDEGPR